MVRVTHLPVSRDRGKSVSSVRNVGRFASRHAGRNAPRSRSRSASRDASSAGRRVSDGRRSVSSSNRTSPHISQAIYCERE